MMESTLRLLPASPHSPSQPERPEWHLECINNSGFEELTWFFDAIWNRN
jgi:hypothetical protein